MRGLFIKDLCLMRELKKLVLIVIFISVVFSVSGTDSTFLTGYIVILTALLAGMTISYDEMNHGLAFFMTLPVTRKQYVAEKYIIGLIMMIVGMLYAFGITAVRILIISDPIHLKENLIVAILCGVIGIIMMSFSIPIDLKFGAEKGRIMLIAGFMVVFLAIFFGLRFLEQNNPELKEAVIQWINETLTGEMIYPFCAVCAILFLGISFLASCRIMEKREF